MDFKEGSTIVFLIKTSAISSASKSTNAPYSLIKNWSCYQGISGQPVVGNQIVYVMQGNFDLREVVGLF